MGILLDIRSMQLHGSHREAYRRRFCIKLRTLFAEPTHAIGSFVDFQGFFHAAGGRATPEDEHHASGRSGCGSRRAVGLWVSHARVPPESLHVCCELGGIRISAEKD